MSNIGYAATRELDSFYVEDDVMEAAIQSYLSDLPS